MFNVQDSFSPGLLKSISRRKAKGGFFFVGAGASGGVGGVSGPAGGVGGVSGPAGGEGGSLLGSVAVDVGSPVVGVGCS